MMILAAVLAGCAAGPDFAVPASPRADHYAAEGDPAATAAADGTSQRFIPGARIEEAWWRRFGSAALDSLMAEALAANPGLDAARANLEQSRHALLAGYGVFFPGVGAEASAVRQQDSPARFGLDSPPSLFNLFTLSGTVSYVLDLFGANRRLVESLGAERDLAEAEERAAFLTLEANIVNTVIARAAYRAEIEATEDLVASERQQVGLAEIQARAGTAPYSAVLILKSQLAATQASLPALAQKASQAEDLLATLAGRAPGGGTAAPIALSSLTLPPDLPVSLPSELVGRRPDILAAEAAAHATSAEIGVATAAMLPNISLSAGYGSSATRGNALFTGPTRFWNFGADATAPLFEGGTLWYRRKAAIDAWRQAEAVYRQTVLAAFGQVADSLKALDHDAQALQAEDDALDAAEQALKLTQANYAAGLAGYLEILAADNQVRQARIGRLQAVAVRYQDTVALFAALGGGP
jgi:NodT family efflux transporter outer membrane factor (OMF) lipoprotein